MKKRLCRWSNQFDYADKVSVLLIPFTFYTKVEKNRASCENCLVIRAMNSAALLNMSKALGLEGLHPHKDLLLEGAIEYRKKG